jgi:ABC-type glutathione transport system ATPase component
MDLVAAIADRAVVLNDGRIVERGTPRQLFTRPDRLYDCGLEPPAVSQLMHRLRAMGIPAPADVLTVEEAVAVLEDLREKSQRHRERRVSQRK